MLLRRMCFCYTLYNSFWLTRKGHCCSNTYLESVTFVSEFPTPRPRFQGLMTQPNLALLVYNKPNRSLPSQAFPPLTSPSLDYLINPRIVSSSHRIEVGPHTQL